MPKAMVATIDHAGAREKSVLMGGARRSVEAGVIGERVEAEPAQTLAAISSALRREFT